MDTPFPYTTLVRSEVGAFGRIAHAGEGHAGAGRDRFRIGDETVEQRLVPASLPLGERPESGRIFVAGAGGYGAADDGVQARAGHIVPRRQDRKSTRLNSSH